MINHFPKWRYHFAFPQAVYERPNCSTSSLVLGFCHIWFLSHFRKYVVSLCIFNLHFPNENNSEYFFHFLCAICLSYVVKWPCTTSARIFKWTLLLPRHPSDRLNTCPWSGTSLANISFNLQIFILLRASFREQKFLFECRPFYHFFKLCFIVLFKKDLANPRSQKCFVPFLLKQDSGYTFTSCIKV